MLQTWISVAGPALTLTSIILLLVAATHDVIARTVPNGLVLALLATGIAARALDQTLVAGCVAGVAVFAVAFLLWRRGWMGGGDVKLLGAGAIVVPPQHVFSFILVMSIAGTVLALVYLTGRAVPGPRPVSRPESLAARALRVERWRLHRGGPLPYACAIAVGAVSVLL
jgi:prepilin peptidase CpaA